MVIHRRTEETARAAGPERYAAKRISILSLLGGSQKLELTPNNTARNIDYNNEYVSTRSKELAEHQLVERDVTSSDPFYSITDFGKKYLAGEIDAESFNREEGG